MRAYARDDPESRRHQRLLFEKSTLGPREIIIIERVCSYNIVNRSY